MMIEVSYLREKEILKTIPQEIQDRAIAFKKLI